jgi:phage pi2 protein 07
MESMLATLKTQLYAYRDIETRLDDIKRDASSLRDQKRQIEKSMSSILARPEFQDFKTLELKDDGTHVNIYRPGEWNKGWSLGKKELDEYLTEYFAQTANPSAKQCHDFISNKQKEKCVGKEYTFDRVVLKKK